MQRLREDIPTSSSLPRSIAPVGKFAMGVGVIAMVWLVLLPQLARIGPIKKHIQMMQDRDINVGAMFYSELNWQPPPGAVWGSRPHAGAPTSEASKANLTSQQEL